VVRRFLRAYFDSDGYAGSQGVILSSTSRSLVGTTQLLLLNFGVLSRIREQTDGATTCTSRDGSAERFHDRIGFGLDRKTRALEAYLGNHRWFLEESWTDESLRSRRARATSTTSASPRVTATSRRAW